MNRATQRLAHAYAVRALRKLGRKLTSGEWGGEPLSVRESVTVIGDAMGTVFRLGIASVVDAAEDALDSAVRQLLGQVDE